MKSGKLAQIVEQHTGAIFVNSHDGSYDGLIPMFITDSEKADFDMVDEFWSRFFAANAQFDADGNLTEISRLNILSYLEAIQASARGVSLELLHGVNIIAAHIQENVLAE